MCSGLHFKDLLWCLRVERGETFGRIHFHAVIAGFPAWFVRWVSTERMCQAWRSFGGGHAKVTVYDSRLDGVDYILADIPGPPSLRTAADYHELTKFGSSCGVTLSESCFRKLKGHERIKTLAVFQPRSYRRFVAQRRPSGTAQKGAGMHPLRAVTWQGDNLLYCR